jgi:hypothetical protein
MPTYNFASEKLMDKVFEIITSPCQFCPVKQGCKLLQGSTKCIERVTEYEERG